VSDVTSGTGMTRDLYEVEWIQQRESGLYRDRVVPHPPAEQTLPAPYVLADRPCTNSVPWTPRRPKWFSKFVSVIITPFTSIWSLRDHQGWTGVRLPCHG
jgi:hypothetical protein